MPNEASEPQLAEAKPTGQLGLLSSYCWSTSPLMRWKRLISPQGVCQVPKSAVSLLDARCSEARRSSGVKLCVMKSTTGVPCARARGACWATMSCPQ